MQAVLEKKSNLLFGKFASFCKSISSKFPHVITSRKKIQELKAAQDEILCLNVDLEGTYAALHSAQDEVVDLQSQVQPKDELIEELRLNIKTLNTKVEKLNDEVTELEINLDQEVGRFLDSHNLRSLKAEWLLRYVEGIELDTGDYDAPDVVKIANRLVSDNVSDLTVEDITWIKRWAEGKAGWYFDDLRFPSRIVVNLSDDLFSQVAQIVSRIHAEKLSSRERCERIKEIIIQDPDQIDFEDDEAYQRERHIEKLSSMLEQKDDLIKQLTAKLTIKTNEPIYQASCTK